MWNDLAGRLRALWSGQSNQNRMLGTGIAGVFVVALLAVGMLYLFNRPHYEVLFSNLTPEDMSNVTAHLKDDKVPYELSQDGKTVFVPSQSLADERIAIAGSGLLKGGTTGYELFDRTNFGMTEFEEQIDKTRAVEGELERTIDGLDPVAASRVNIAAPNDNLFADASQATTASVAITTKPGMALTPEEVQGITMLVARGVAGLRPSDVTIVDQDGNVLVPSATAADPEGATNAVALTQQQLEAKQRYESAVQAKIQSMLDSTLGPHRAVARVSTKMSFDATSVESKTYAPAGTVLSSESKRESYTGSGPARAIGVPGTTSNIPTYQASASSNNGKYNNSQTTTNFDVSESTTKHIDAPGKVLQTSVAVILNSATVSPGPVASGAPAQSYQITPAMRNQIQSAVVAAAGLDLATGDQVSVQAIPFNPATNPPPALALPGSGAPAVLGVPVWGVAAALGILALLGLGLAVGRARRGSNFTPAMELPSFDSTLAEELPPFEEHPILDGAPGIAAPIRSAADLTREQMIEYVTTVAQENPDSIAKLVKLWLAE